MVKSASRFFPDGSFDLLPLAVAILISETYKDDITLFGEVFGLLGGVDHHLIIWVIIGFYLVLNDLRGFNFEGD
jgi:hypothetical protein